MCIGDSAYLTLQQCLPLAVLKHLAYVHLLVEINMGVATVLTACGIETNPIRTHSRWSLQLQQCLPLVVLKLCCIKHVNVLQQLIRCNSTYRLRYWNPTNSPALFACLSCNSTYRLRYWNGISSTATLITSLGCCNSTYRLRYWNKAIPRMIKLILLV